MESNPVRRSTKSRSTTQECNNAVHNVEPIASSATAKKLRSFTVTADSVVATAKIVFDSSHRHIALHWGDDQVEAINLTELRLLSTQPGQAQEPNTLTFQHVYRPPLDHGRTIVIAVTTDSNGERSYDVVVLELERRYKFTFYPITLTFPDHLDSVFETESEVEARMVAYQNSRVFHSRQWRDDHVVTAPQITTGEDTVWRLKGSEFTREISYSDPPIYVDFFLQEHDGIGDEGSVVNLVWDLFSAPFRAVHWYVEVVQADFDGSNFSNPLTLPFKVHPSENLAAGRANGKATLWPDGEIFIEFEYEMRLIVPIDRSMEQVMTMS